MPESPINWPQVYDLLEKREDRIVKRFLDAIAGVERKLDAHETRIDTLEHTAERRTGSQATAVLFLGLPQKVIGLVASAVALVLAIATAWSIVRPMP